MNETEQIKKERKKKWKKLIENCKKLYEMGGLPKSKWLKLNSIYEEVLKTFNIEDPEEKELNKKALSSFTEIMRAINEGKK